MKILELIAKICSAIAGLLLILVAMVICYSVLARELWGAPIQGDFELVGIGVGAALALFLPWCQWQRSHIMVDFFTQKLSGQLNAKLDRVGYLLMGAVLGLLAWRASLGGLSAYQSQSSSMLLGFPEWIVYTFIVPGLVLSAVIALTQCFFGATGEAHEASL